MKLRPMNNQVFLIEDHSEVTSKSGIIIEAEKKVSSQGTIYEIQKDNEHGLKKGDKVLFSRYAREDVLYVDDEGNKVPNLITVHYDSIHALLK